MHVPESLNEALVEVWLSSGQELAGRLTVEGGGVKHDFVPASDQTVRVDGRYVDSKAIVSFNVLDADEYELIRRTGGKLR